MRNAHVTRRRGVDGGDVNSDADVAGGGSATALESWCVAFAKPRLLKVRRVRQFKAWTLKARLSRWCWR